eukprot:2953091-Rhodomonas_salina.1
MVKLALSSSSRTRSSPGAKTLSARISGSEAFTSSSDRWSASSVGSSRPRERAARTRSTSG